MFWCIFHEDKQTFISLWEGVCCNVLSAWLAMRTLISILVFKHFGEPQLLIPQLDIRAPQKEGRWLSERPWAPEGGAPTPSRLALLRGTVYPPFLGPMATRRALLQWRSDCTTYLHENLCANSSLEWKLTSTFSWPKSEDANHFMEEQAS